MAIVTKIPGAHLPPPPPLPYTIDIQGLTQDEAEALTSLLGHLRHDNPLSGLYNKLYRVGITDTRYELFSEVGKIPHAPMLILRDPKKAHGC